jgi:hypothetical protein
METCMLQVYQQPHAPKGEKEETHHGNGKTNYNLKYGSGILE